MQVHISPHKHSPNSSWILLTYLTHLTHFFNQDSIGDLLLALERESRCHVAAALQRMLLLFRAAHCCRPAVQWYVSGLRRCRKLFHKVLALVPFTCHFHSCYLYIKPLKHTFKVSKLYFQLIGCGMWFGNRSEREICSLEITFLTG